MTQKTGVVLIVMSSLSFLGSVVTLALAYHGVKTVQKEVENVQKHVENVQQKFDKAAENTRVYFRAMSELS